jgi:hypothetical protein
MSDWRSGEPFAILCDQVASDYLVCLTGAGISTGMKRDGGSGLPLPSWTDLLRELHAALGPQMEDEDAKSATRLLAPGGKISSDELILAATLIRRANRAEFDHLFRAAITEEPGQFSPTHSALLELLPRGIMTFNYDCGHEAACVKMKRPFTVLNPTEADSEADFRTMMEDRLRKFFLLKAHGSVESREPLVLTTEEYRNLLIKNPAFRSFVQHLFTNFSFVIVGYGLDDPDFALFTRTMVEQFGGPLQKHVAVRHERDSGRHEEVQRHQYGIHTLYVADFAEIPEVLQVAATTPGPAMKETLALCLSPVHADRNCGHAALAMLGPAGRAVAAAALIPSLTDPDSFLASEAAFSLGKLDARAHKQRLCDLVDSRPQADVLGRTLTVLREVLDTSDIGRLKEWQRRYSKNLPEGERAERIPKYLDYLVIYIEHKFKSDPPAAAPAAA